MSSVILSIGIKTLNDLSFRWGLSCFPAYVLIYRKLKQFHFLLVMRFEFIQIDCDLSTDVGDSGPICRGRLIETRREVCESKLEALLLALEHGELGR